MIRRVLIEASHAGIDAAMADITSASEKTSKATLSVEQALEKHQRSFDRALMQTIKPRGRQKPRN